MQELTDIIQARIRQSATLPFERYMAMALYEPGLGYYTSEATEIGREGDFYTSPHLHRLFGAMLGRQAEELWEHLGKPGEFHIIEAGAGRGYLALDMLDYLRPKPLYSHLTYHIVELNPTMAKRQAELLLAYAHKLSWHKALTELAGLTGLLLSNELIDAIPVHVIQKSGPLWQEICIKLDDKGGFSEAFVPVSSEDLTAYIDKYIPPTLPEGYRTEVNLGARDWLKQAASALGTGLILTIDYGYPAMEYYDEERTRGTLLAYHKHTASEDFYTEPGRRDLTAHVNFSSLRDWGVELGLRPVGYARQGVYLVSLGLDEAITELYGPDPGSAGLDVMKLQGLIMPGTMGDTHKVLAMTKGMQGSPRFRGFAMKNQLDRL